MKKMFESLIQEREDLRRKIASLEFYVFISPKYRQLETYHKKLICEQLSTMRIYLSIIEARLEHIGMSVECGARMEEGQDD